MCAVLPACSLCITSVPGAHVGCPDEGLDSLEPEYKIVVSNHVVAGHWTYLGPLQKQDVLFLPTEPSFQPKEVTSRHTSLLLENIK